jgi:hypothetical protein
MKTVNPPRQPGNEGIVLTITIDPLRVARGPRRLPRGGVHQSARHPGRAQGKRQLRRLLADG